jgi:hypothetical protein
MDQKGKTSKLLITNIMKKQIISLSLLLVGLFLSSLSLGQGPKADKKALRKEVKAYVEQNIIPVMQPQRAALEAELSSRDKQELNEIRQGLQALREQKQAKMKEMRQNRKGQGERPEPSDAQIAARREAEKAHRQLMTRAWALADAHESSIYGLLDEVREEQKQWKKDLGEMMKNHREEMKENHPEERPSGGKAGPGHHARRGHKGAGMLAIFHQPVAFLLWDGTLPEGPGQKRGAGQEDLRVFPNPIPESGNNQLRFELKQAGTVTISLMDEEGTVVKTLLKEKRPAGEYTESFLLEDLPAGIYFYRVESPGQRQVKRILVE